ncbi:hypothetical protein EF903_05290 [Streptomyces sp. WAC05292]|uniref:hypothetical protein n=1 Tax=Streptomyces sp. WAC05292 TaxID=2487418 RepID=UPI000F7401B6|nr:hypothetical protein [Streptomyces sp. WAC05292]RSS95057.1 hypothetical protein EF903_05290 [Streptomyces sp. WAC05292]
MDRTQQAAQARLIAAGHAREVADFARGIVGGTSSDAPAIERIQEARRLRLLSLQQLNWTVRAEVLQGTPWSVIAAGLGRDEEAVRAQFEVGTQQWADRTAQDPEAEQRSLAEAEALDEWYRVQAVDLLDPVATAPVSSLFTHPKN